MKPIKLNKHQIYLLETMCDDRRLFPDYNYDGEFDSQMGEIAFRKMKGESKLIYFHWLDFCLNELPKRIFALSLEGEKPVTDTIHLLLVERMIREYYNGKIHPIDFLYSQFSKSNKQ